MEDKIKSYFGFIVFVAAILGLVLPSIGNKLSSLIIPSLFVLMLVVVLRVDFNRLFHIIKKPTLLFLAVFISYIVVPFILYMFACLFSLDENAKMSVMFSALAPTILSAPYFVSIMKGDVEFSFALSIIITFLAPFLIPLELYYIFETDIVINYSDIFQTIFIIVFVPILIVYIWRMFFSNYINKVLVYETFITALIFFIFTWAIISVNSYEILKFSPYISILVLIGIIQEFGIYILLRYISQIFMSNKLSKSFAFSIAVKNTALTAGIAVSLSSEFALASSIVIMLHVPMLAWVMHSKFHK